jgi:streptogramin lyase
MAALLAAVAVGFCLTVGASLVHADGSCPASDASSPRFCAQSGMTDHALVVAAPVIPVTARPEPAVWLPVSHAQPLGKWHHRAASPPRAPPTRS